MIRNDECSLEEIILLDPDAIVISPGPGIPATSGMLMPLIEHFHDKKPMLGICTLSSPGIENAEASVGWIAIP